MQEKKIKAGIVGGTGYTGVELLRLLSRHPNVEVCAITSRKDGGTKVTAMYPSLRGFMDDLVFTTPEEAELTACDVVFFATPHGVAMSMARELTAAGVKLIDLAADFRLRDTDTFKTWYHRAFTRASPGDGVGQERKSGAEAIPRPITSGVILILI